MDVLAADAFGWPCPGYPDPAGTAQLLRLALEAAFCPIADWEGMAKVLDRLKREHPERYRRLQREDPSFALHCDNIKLKAGRKIRRRRGVVLHRSGANPGGQAASRAGRATSASDAVKEAISAALVGSPLSAAPAD